MINQCHIGCVFKILPQLIDQGFKADCVVTSPPYYQLRDYGVPGQFGLEDTLEEFIVKMVKVFGLVHQVLSDKGTLWLNMGDSYSQSGMGGHQEGVTFNPESIGNLHNKFRNIKGFRPKNLLGVPWRLAFALQDYGWNLRQDIIWNKPTCMPESVKDRCTKSHEYIFLFSKSKKYYFNHEAIKEPVTGNAHPRGQGVNPKCNVLDGWDTGPGNHRGKKGRYRDTGVGYNNLDKNQPGNNRKPRPRHKQNESFSKSISGGLLETRAKRSVWTVTSEPFSDAHFATFPTKLIQPCILAGTKPGGIVLDPFMGSGTTAQVAQELGRDWVGIELNPEYVELQKKRIKQIGMAL